MDGLRPAPIILRSPRHPGSGFVITTSPRFAARSVTPRDGQISEVPCLRDLPADKVLEFCNTSPAMEVICQDPEFWESYYQHNFSTDQSALLKNYTNDHGSPDYHAGSLAMEQIVRRDGSLVTALKLGLDRVIIRRKLWNSDPSLRSELVSSAIIGGNFQCLVPILDYPFDLSHLALARKQGNLELYRFFHNRMLEQHFIKQRYDNPGILFEICLVRDDVFGFRTYVNGVSSQFLTMSVVSGAARIVKALLLLIDRGLFDDEFVLETRNQLLNLSLSQPTVSVEIVKSTIKYHQGSKIIHPLAYPLEVIELLDSYQVIDFTLDYSGFSTTELAINLSTSPRSTINKNSPNKWTNFLWLLARYPPTDLLSLVNQTLFERTKTEAEAIFKVLSIESLLTIQDQITIPRSINEFNRSNLTIFLQRIQG